jgi:hypothetical protein
LRRRDLLWLFLLALAVRLAVATLIPRPGYMDPAYYAAGALHLAQGGGLNEPFIWNYLDAPAGLPHPGFLYWMPLPSLLAAPFAALFPGSFFALQLPFALLSALFPLVGYAVAWEATGVRRPAWVVGLLTLFSGFFFHHWTLPETFAPFALFGSVALWLAGSWGLEAGSRVKRIGRWLSVGLLVGLAHLTRADGILLLPVVALAPLASLQSRNRRRGWSSVIGHWSLIFFGYLLVMTPWVVRSLSLIGAPVSPAGAKTLWLRTYDDIFCYECDLSLNSYLAWGWGNILRSKLWALWVNLERFLAEDCLVFLLPFVFIGFWRLRRRSPFAIFLVCLLLIYIFHSLAFTFPGARGGFFHASAALLPFLFTAGVEGLDAAVGWASRRRRWDRRQAVLVFRTAAVVAAVALSLYAAAGKVPTWWGADEVYLEVHRWLEAHDVPASTVVMVGNPPGFWYHTHRAAVVVPNGDADTLLEVCARYHVGYVVLDENRPHALAGVYEGAETAGLEPVAILDDGQVRLYRYTGRP